MSENSDSVVVPSEVLVKKPTDAETANSDVKDQKMREKDSPAEPVVNGALPEELQSEEVKSKSDGLAGINGVESKAASAHREIPGLLPLQPLQIQIGQLPVPAVSSQLPVIATKSAPPPVPSTPPKTPSPPVSNQKGRTVSEGSSGKPEENTTDAAEEAPMVTKKRGRKRKSVLSDVKSENDDSYPETDDGGRKSKRTRTQTRPFQSSDMDATLLRALKATAVAAQQHKTRQEPKTNDDKLVVFFKGEFLAVRNADGGFYVCQAMQNIYRGSHKIKIRWLSEVEKAPEKTEELEIYSPDFYDHTDFECILTNLDIEKLGREKYGLPLEERKRTENILKRALDVEKGVTEKPQVTEEHPDGLDVSLFHDESQLKPKKRGDEDDDESSSESDTHDGEVCGTSGAAVEPEPATSSSSGAGGQRKRTRAAAVAAAEAQRSVKFYYDGDEDDEDQSSEDDDDEADQDIEDETTSESEPERPKRRKSSPRASSPPKSRTRTTSKGRRKSKRGKKPTPPKTKPVIQSKAALKEHPPLPDQRSTRTPRLAAKGPKTPAKTLKAAVKTPKTPVTTTPKGRRGRPPAAKRGQKKETSEEDEEKPQEVDQDEDKDVEKMEEEVNVDKSEVAKKEIPSVEQDEGAEEKKEEANEDVKKEIETQIKAEEVKEDAKKDEAQVVPAAGTEEVSK